MSTTPRQYARFITRKFAQQPESFPKVMQLLKEKLVSSSQRDILFLSSVVHELRRSQRALSRVENQRTESAPSPFVELYQRLIAR